MRYPDSHPPSFDFGGDGPPLHFLHANGCPPACYLPLLQQLRQDRHVFGMLLRPLWRDLEPQHLRDWHPLSLDLLQFLAHTSSQPVVGVGHSIGAIVTLRAALRNPSAFCALVLLDPVLFIPSSLLSWKLTRALGLGSRFHPLIRSALKRRTTFDDLDKVFRAYRTRPIFKYFDDHSLRAYIAGITRPRPGGGFELVYSPAWEAHIYLTGLRDFDLWHALPALQVPTLILRGAESNTFLSQAAALVERRNPRIQVRTLEHSTHLLPLEIPHQVAAQIESFLAKI